MPWSIRKIDGEFCVIKDDDGENEGCHASRTEAEAQMAALYASEESKGILDQAIDRIKGMFAPKEKPLNSFMAWKEKHGWRWLAIYSNKYRDEDVPPEIIAEVAHKDFIKAVDADEWDFPDLMLWHVAGTEIGEADFLAYDDRGFAIASGMGDPEILQFLSQEEDIQTSHGMPTKEIKRDSDDPTILTRYRTKEISVLPGYAAANKLTAFVPLEVDMSIPEAKKEFLEKVMGESAVQELDQHLSDKAKEAEGLEFKEEDEDETEAESEVEPESQEKDDAGDDPKYVTEDQVADAVGAVVASINERIGGIAEQLAGLLPVSEAVDELKEVLAGLQMTDEEKIKEQIRLTPGAALFDRIQERAVGSDEAKIDGRSSLAKAGPEEAATSGPTVVPFVNQLMAGRR